MPRPPDIGGDPGNRTASLKAAIVSRNIVVEYADNLGGALGLSCGGRIPVLTGLPPASEFAVLTHEYAHKLLHRDADRPNSRDTRELEAEAVAFVVEQAVGLEVSDASRDYIHLYHGDSNALTESLGRIQQTASLILRAIGFCESASESQATSSV